MRGYDLVALHAAGSGHAGGTLSIMDITAALYLRVADQTPAIPIGKIATALFGPQDTKLPASTWDWHLRDFARSKTSPY